MKARIVVDGKTHRLRPLNAIALVLGMSCCPRCGRRGPVHARGTGKRIESRDTYASDAVATCCGLPLGEMRVTVSTIFGLEEDENVCAMVERLGGKIF